MAAEQAPPMELTAAQASGGSRSEDGNAAYLAAASDLKDEVRWTLPTPLAAGAWRLTVEFDGKVKGAKNQVIGLVAEHTPLIDCYVVDTTRAQSFVLATTSPASGVFYRRTANRGQDTVRIRSLRLEPVTTPSPTERWYLDCPVRDGAAVLAWPLAPGNLKATSDKPVSLAWTSAGGSFSTPSSARTFASITERVETLRVEGPCTVLSIERHPLLPVPEMAVPTAKDLTVVSDAARSETRTLTLIGATGGAPAMAWFPGGRTQAIFTTWDDGNVADLTVANMLKKHGFRGTFLMNRNSAMIPRLGELEALGMEIGSHSWSHPTYNLSGYQRCRAESVQMRLFLEGQLGHPVISFAYPFGYQPAYDAQGDYVLRSLKDAGYWYARTTNSGPNRIDSIANPLTLTEDFHFNAGAARIASRFAEVTAKPGAVFEVWGHSYELNGGGEATLEGVLTALAGRPDVWYATGGEIFVWRWMRENTVFSAPERTANGMIVRVTRPWLHPHLRSVPCAVTVPSGTTAVLWEGASHPVVDGVVDLPW